MTTSDHLYHDMSLSMPHVPSLFKNFSLSENFRSKFSAIGCSSGKDLLLKVLVGLCDSYQNQKEVRYRKLPSSATSNSS